VGDQTGGAARAGARAPASRRITLRATMLYLPFLALPLAFLALRLAQQRRPLPLFSKETLAGSQVRSPDVCQHWNSGLKFGRDEAKTTYVDLLKENCGA
jgi:hypothetical protein